MTANHVGLPILQDFRSIPALKSASEQQSTWLEELDRAMRREVRLQRMACEEVWHTPLGERIERGTSLGPLSVVSVAGNRVLLQAAGGSAVLADCSLREGDFVCLSRNTPLAPIGRFIHSGEDDDGIHLLLWKGGMPPASGSDWVIDPDFYDMTDRFAEAIEGLAVSDLGRSRILPLLMGEAGSALDPELHELVMDGLEHGGPQASAWHDTQREAIAACVATHDAYLVQGPPGTGKTRVLAEVARLLVERGERVLVTGPTHRAINHALEDICKTVPATVGVAKIGFQTIAATSFRCFEDYASSGLFDCDVPHVVGATPHSLWSKRSGLREAHFDTVLLEEASQLTPLLAAMAMQRGDRWLFFGDDCQLPPVVPGDDSTPARQRSVFGRLKNRGFDTLLEESWRLNRPLAEWPSATFYSNRLSCRHDHRLVLSQVPRHAALLANPAACLICCDGGRRTTVRSDPEAQLAADLVREAVLCGMEPERIGVITPFRAQAARIRQLLGIDHGTGSLRRRVVVDTVERYQGEERDLIVVTIAASDPRFIRLRADFLFQSERWNVAVTRARLKMIVIASQGLLETADLLAGEGHAGAMCFASLIDHLRSQTC
jgi:DNA replication ATP-dependent helicase Dna2